MTAGIEPSPRRRLTVLVLLITVVSILLGMFGTTANAAPPDDHQSHEASEPTPLEGMHAMAGGPVARADVMARAKTWVDRGVPYSNTNKVDGYRADCSGFVSFAWQATQSWITSSLPQISHRIEKDELLPGDILLWVNPNTSEMGHARLFGGWLDTVKSRYWVYEQTPPKAIYHEYLWNNTAAQYPPYRYNNIVTQPADSAGVIYAGDYNADGKADIISQDASGALKAFTGSGAMDASQFGYGVDVGWGWDSGKAPRVLKGDFNGDGKEDLIANSANGTLKAFPSSGVFKNNELFGYGAEVGWDWTTASTPRIIVGDFNGDGKDDLIAQRADGSLRAFTSSGSMDAAQFGYGVDVGWGWDPNTAPRILVGDFNSDGKDDLISNLANGTMKAFPSSGVFKNNELFGYGAEVGWGWTTASLPRVMVGDFNGDGKDDLISQNTGGALKAFTGSGSMDSAQFGYGVDAGWGWDTGTAPRILVGDYNGDGKDDLVSGGANGVLKAFPSSGVFKNNELFGYGAEVGWGWTPASSPRIF
ncbi:C40 family peptidase [Amycolatopsis sp. H20-H5]|uniref:C40 family peptidase n=1 Tax=Amycolatopsis sp. H20-H5 TaxID=3046309 RepID=UPI002DBFCA77|nr:FG-GAP-like repeat-containing protein [Amycolatopsis sp. H20-H5]MEC3981036.1 FG-GAP-like repeat-containing protein [Amycolatopsis sp. H20-H5]